VRLIIPDHRDEYGQCKVLILIIALPVLSLLIPQSM
jgi:hypothetical protein